MILLIQEKLISHFFFVSSKNSLVNSMQSGQSTQSSGQVDKQQLQILVFVRFNINNNGNDGNENVINGNELKVKDLPRAGERLVVDSKDQKPW